MYVDPDLKGSINRIYGSNNLVVLLYYIFFDNAMMHHRPSSYWDILAGCMLDHIDTYLYIYGISLLSGLFSPVHEPWRYVLNMYGIHWGTSSIAYLASVFIFGYACVQKPPRFILTICLWGFSGATFLIGCIPTFEKIGAISTLFFISLRVIQLFFARGERNIARLYLTKTALQEKPFLGIMFYEASVVIGIAMSAIIVSYLKLFSGQYPFLWRAPYIIFGLVGMMIALYRQCNYSSSSDAYTPGPSAPDPVMPLSFIGHMLSIDWRHILLCIGALSFVFAPYAFIFESFHRITAPMADVQYGDNLLSIPVFLIFDFVLIIVSSLILQKMSISLRDNMRVIYGCLFAFMACLIFFIQNSSWHYSTIIFRVGVITIGVIYTLVSGVIIAQSMDYKKGYIHTGLSSVLSSIIFGKSTSLVILWIYQKKGLPYACSYLLFPCFLAFFCCREIGLKLRTRDQK